MPRPSEKARLASIADGILRRTRGHEAEIAVRETDGFLLRFSPGRVQQNGIKNSLAVSIRLSDRGRSARADISSAEPAEIQRALQNLKVLLNAQKAKTALPLPGPQSYDTVHDYDCSIEQDTPSAASEKVRQFAGRKSDISGYYSSTVRSVLLANSAGLRAHHASSACRFGLNVRNGAGEGYASAFSPAVYRLPMEKTVEQAFERARLARREVSVKPGHYQVLLAPRAFAEFVSPLAEELNGRKAAEGESFFSGKEGHALFSPHFTLDDDARYFSQTGLPFDGDGMPRRRLRLFSAGKQVHFVYDRKAAREFRKEPTGHASGLLGGSTAPVNWVLYPGRFSVEEILQNTKEALVIHHLWYHQVVERRNFIATGLCKGSALVWKNGRWAGGARRLRYFVSIPEALRSISALSSVSETVKDREHGAGVFPHVLIKGFRIA